MKDRHRPGYDDRQQSPDPANRRAYRLTLTAEGERRRAAAADVLHACDDHFLEVLSGDERAELIRLLRKLAAAPED